MADTIGLSDVSSKDTGKGKELKTGNLKRSYNMAKSCPKGQIYDQKTKECRVATQPHKKQRTIKEYSAKEKARIRKRSRATKSGLGIPGTPYPGEGTKRVLKPSEYGKRKRAKTMKIQASDRDIRSQMPGLLTSSESEYQRRYGAKAGSKTKKHFEKYTTPRKSKRKKRGER